MLHSRVLGILVAAIATLWALPALVVRMAYAELTLEDGRHPIQVSLDGVWPDWPFGVRAERITVRSGNFVTDLVDARTRISSGGLRLDGVLGSGSVHAQTSLDGARGFVRLDDVPLEHLGVAGLPVGITGAADIVARWGEGAVADGGDAADGEGVAGDGGFAVEAWVARGSIRSAEGLFAIEFRQLVVDAVQDERGLWEIRLLRMQGPPLTLSGRGNIAPAGSLGFVLEVESAEEPARGYLRLLGVRDPTPPFELSVRGTLWRPRVRAIRSSEPRP